MVTLTISKLTPNPANVKKATQAANQSNPAEFSRTDGDNAAFMGYSCRHREIAYLSRTCAKLHVGAVAVAPGSENRPTMK